MSATRERSASRGAGVAGGAGRAHEQGKQEGNDRRARIGDPTARFVLHLVRVAEESRAPGRSFPCRNVWRGPAGGARLAAARHGRFIGRLAEVALFRAALVADGPPFTVCHVHGPGGVGKSTLLREYARAARDAGRTVLALDGRNIQPSRPAVALALAEALGDGDADGPQGASVPERAVVLVDAYERLSALDAWVRDTLLPGWPADVLVVLAGREPPSLAWRTDLGWAPTTRIVELGNFGPDEAAAFLESRGVAPAAHGTVLGFTRGHPLALSLVADVLARSGEPLAFDPLQAPDVVRHLLGLFLEAIPAGPRRDALEVCAIARVTTEPLLVDLLGAEEGSAAFQWLRAQPFVDSGALGLCPHDLVRELLLADALWRDEEGLRRLSRRVYGVLQAHIAAARGARRQRLQMDALYVTRTRPTNAAFFDWGALDGVRVEPAEAEDAGWILAAVDRHEGPASAELARHWLRVQPAAFHVFRGTGDAPFGFLALLDIGGPAGSAAAVDPAVAAALAFVERHGPARDAEAVVHLRWWMHAEAYQAVTAAINLTAMHVVSHCISRPGMAWNFVAMAEPSFWAAHFDGVNFARVAEADFEVAGRRYGVFAHDWRIEPPADWMMGSAIPMPFSRPPAGPGTPSHGLSEPEFRRAVRRALRDYARPVELAESPLRSARMLLGSPHGPASPAALQGLLRQAAEALRSNPRDMKLYRAVWHTYFEPLATQEAVAERLDLPFSTYRHHLGRAIDRIGTWLWQRERAAPRP